jgi:hypothetical protein
MKTTEDPPLLPTVPLTMLTDIPKVMALGMEAATLTILHNVLFVMVVWR